MKNNILRIMLIFSFIPGMFVSSDAYAQVREISTATVTGRVITAEEQPVPGIVVKAFNTGKAVTTDLQGNFSIDVSDEVADRIAIDERGFKTMVIVVAPGTAELQPVVLERISSVDESSSIDMPYRILPSNRNVTAVTTITGEELASYPAASLLEALAGRIAGLVVQPWSTMPGQESISVYIRGAAATIYIDGIMRDITGLSASEVDKVSVIKDMSGRAMLGLSGVNPVIWITTKKGTAFNKAVTVSAQYGVNSPATLPSYLDAYNYATLLNEALENDGLDAWFTQDDLDAYRNHTNPLTHPDVDYYSEYMAKRASFRAADITFEGGDNKVSYLSMFNYLGNSGLESVGEKINNDRYKLRGNVDIKLNNFMSMSVNIAASLNKQRYPNVSDGAGVYNMFDILSVYPANAHPIYADDKLIISDNFPVNLTNELAYSGFGDGTILNAQNDAKLLVDLNSVIKGLSVVASASFDVTNSIISSKGGTAALYRLVGETPVRVVEADNVTTMSLGNFDVFKRTAGYINLNYDRQFGKSSLAADAVFYAALEEYTSDDDWYQPGKYEDLTLRLNYGFDDRYVAEIDLAYSGSNRMPEGKRFSLYPSAGLAWIASNESFLNGSTAIDYLKLFANAGIMGVNDYYLAGYNPFYLQETLWTWAGGWQPGIAGNTGEYVNYYKLVQTGTDDFVLPKRGYINVGVQSELFDKALEVEINYFTERNYDKISNRSATTPSIIGSPQFLPAVNYGEDVRWGIDGSVQLSKHIGDFSYGIGLNAMYMRGKYVVVDEPDALPDYKKVTGTDMDAFWLYEAEGLFQSESEISTRDITQIWGTLQPGDIKYTDINDDHFVDEFDIHATDYHSPRLFYGVNISVGYKGFNLYLLGQGVANGSTMLSSNRYFMVNGTSQNYSELMLDRYPYTNDYPRLTTVSENNYQNSTFWVANAAYFRIKNIELSYSIPAAVTHRYAMNGVRVFVRGNNIAVFSGLKKYNVDPENINAGITGYPLFRTVTAGVSCKF